MATRSQSTQIDVFVGVDVGKGEHHAVALNVHGEVLLDRSLPQDEAELRCLVDELAEHGRVLFVVDQPATIGALALTVARAAGADVGYLPGLAMRRIADLHAGEAKTDARDAAIIAQAARTLPHALRALRRDDEITTELTMLAGFDEDLAGQINQVSNRIRGLLTHIHPALERVIGPKLNHVAVLHLLESHPSPALIRSAGRSRIVARMRKHAPRIGERIADEIFAALEQQTVTVAETDIAAKVLTNLAEQLIMLRRQRADIAGQVETIVEAHPHFELMTSMPGVGPRTAARILVETSGRDFATAGHLAAYAGLAPVTRRSGSSIRGERQPKRGNRRLKRALYLSAFSALKDPTSRAYYDKKRSENKSHQQALLALARRRCDVLYAMIRDQTHYNPNRTIAA